MSLIKMVNGVEVICSSDEETAILAEWAANTITLSDYKTSKINTLTLQLHNTVDAAFSAHTRDMFNWLYANANANSLPNRATYCQQLATWGESCYSAWQTAVNSVNAASDTAGVDGVTLTLTSPPAITLAGAMAINT